MIPEKSGILKHALHNDCRTDDEAEFIYQRSAEKSQAANNRVKADTSRMAATGLKQQPPPPPPPTATGTQSGGLAAAMTNASKQETMMPGHRLRERPGRLGTYL